MFVWFFVFCCLCVCVCVAFARVLLLVFVYFSLLFVYLVASGSTVEGWVISTDNPILIASYRTKCGIWISHMTPNTEHRTTTTNHQKKVVRNSFSAGGPSGRDAHVFFSTEHPQNVRRPAPLFAPAPPLPLLAPPLPPRQRFFSPGFLFATVLFARCCSPGLFRQVFFARVFFARVFVRQGGGRG